MRFRKCRGSRVRNNEANCSGFVVCLYMKAVGYAIGGNAATLARQGRYLYGPTAQRS